jgi:hypothetical protein
LLFPETLHHPANRNGQNSLLFIEINCFSLKLRSKKRRHFVESCFIREYLKGGNCGQLLKHPFIEDCEDIQFQSDGKYGDDEDDQDDDHH